MRSEALQRILDRTPADVDVLVKWYAEILDRIEELMTEKGYTQKYLAEKLDKQPSEINRWLSGDHNFTIRSLAKLQVELGEILLIAPTKTREIEFTPVFSNKIDATLPRRTEKLIKVAKWSELIYTPRYGTTG